MKPKAIALLFVLLLSAVGAGIVFGGGEVYSPARLWEVLSHPPAAGEVQPPDWAILVGARIPRALCAALVGACLALSGVLLQGLFRNPLASPGILGASAGGAFAAVVAMAIGLSGSAIFWGPLFSFAGTLFAVVTVYLLSIERQRVEATHLILCGVAVNTIFAAGTSLVLALSIARHDLGRQIVSWLAGGFQHAGWAEVSFLAPVLAVSLGAAVFLARDLNLMLTGEESARTLGVRIDRLKRRVLFISALATGAAVAAAGMIGFVGLIVPHILRLLLGPDHRHLLFTATCFGGLFLALTELLAVRVHWPEYIPVGVITSLAGGPFFLLLLIRLRRRAAGE
jgi:iron complex transport system permease protein